MKYFLTALLLLAALPGRAQPQKKVPAPPQDTTLWRSHHTEVQPRFPGDLSQYLANHLEYPETVEDVQGKVYIRFIIRKDGTLTDAEVMRSLAPAFDAEALRVVRHMPKWLPAKQDDVPVDCWFVLPVVFTLE